MDDKYPGDDKAPVLTPKELERSKIQIALYKKEITMEQAKAQGFVPDEPWGMSELRPDDLPEPSTEQKHPKDDSEKPEWLRGVTGKEYPKKLWENRPPHANDFNPT